MGYRSIDYGRQNFLNLESLCCISESEPERNKDSGRLLFSVRMSEQDESFLLFWNEGEKVDWKGSRLIDGGSL